MTQMFNEMADLLLCSGLRWCLVQWSRFQDLCLIKSDGGRVFGFHPHTLEVAELPTTAMTQPSADVVADLNAWLTTENTETQDAFEASGVRTLSLNVAQICNLKCDYCAAGGDGTYGSKLSKIDLSKAEKQIQHFVGTLTQGDNLEIHFLGGEPLLYPQVIRRLCDYAKLMVAGTNKSVSFSTTTNGTLFNPITISLLRDYHFAVTVSIDGKADVQDAYRPAKNGGSSSSMVEAGLELLKPVRSALRALKVNSVFGKHNVNVLETYQYLESLGLSFDEYNFNFANGDKSKEISDLYIQSMQDVARAAVASDGLTALSKIAQFARPLSRVMAQTRVHSYCGSTRSLVQADTAGDLYGCNWFIGDETEKIGHLTTIQPAKVESRTLIEANNCGSCWARHLCGGGCQAVHKAFSGSKHQKDTLFCERTRDLAATALIHYAGCF